MKTVSIPTSLVLYCTDKYDRHFTGLIHSPAPAVVEKTPKNSAEYQSEERRGAGCLGTVIKFLSLIFQF